MGVHVSYWDRRDGSDRLAVGQAAFEYCRAQRIVPGVTDARYYWVGPDQIVVQTHTTTVYDWGMPDPKVGESLFSLGDVARQVRQEQWVDASAGMDNYRRSGRAV